MILAALHGGLLKTHLLNLPVSLGKKTPSRTSPQNNGKKRVTGGRGRQWTKLSVFLRKAGENEKKRISRGFFWKQNYGGGLKQDSIDF